MSRFKRRAQLALALASTALVVGVVVASPASAATHQTRALACAYSTSQGSGPFTGRLLVGPPGMTFATYIRTTVTNLSPFGWLGTVTVNSQPAASIWLAPQWGLGATSVTVNGPTVIGQQYVYFKVAIDPNEITSVTQLAVRVCA
jgi:hypothetical protein